MCLVSKLSCIVQKWPTCCAFPQVTTPFSLANVDLAQYGLSVVPRNTLELKPKEIRTLEFTFAPTVRLHSGPGTSQPVWGI